jgi:hypothetical protein
MHERKPLFIVDPVLHSSGFGNQCGMLLQHVALAALGGRTLVLPPIHQPAEHRRSAEVEDSLQADEAFNLSSFAPLARVMSSRQLSFASAELTFASLHDSQQPLHLTPEPSSLTAAVVRLLRQPDNCSASRSPRVTEDEGRCQSIIYCHLTSCRTHTRRACRRLPHGCSRTAQRLPNNYLFAHRLAPLLCVEGRSTSKSSDELSGCRSGSSQSASSRLLSNRRTDRGGIPTDDEASSGGGGDGVLFGSLDLLDDQATDAILIRMQQCALRLLRLGESVRARASQLASRLGRYAAMHVRLADMADSTSKGVRASDIAALIGRLVPRLGFPDCQSGEAVAHSFPGDAGSTAAITATAASAVTSAVTAAPIAAPLSTLYVASNQPDTIRNLLPAIAAAASEALTRHRARRGCGPSTVRVSSWSELAEHVIDEPWRHGLRSALIEHELCVLAAHGFAGSQFSTWSNLIGARRRVSGVPSKRAYLDLQSGAVVASCEQWSEGRTDGRLRPRRSGSHTNETL